VVYAYKQYVIKWVDMYKYHTCDDVFAQVKCFCTTFSMKYSPFVHPSLQKRRTVCSQYSQRLT